MTEVIAQIRERYARAQVRLDKARRALEAAEAQVADLEAALRVLAGIMPESVDPMRASHSDQVSERQMNLIKVLPRNKIFGLEPKLLSEKYAITFPDDQVGLDVLRTTLWRMKERGTVYPYENRLWQVESGSGRYWRQRVERAPDADGEQTGEAPID